MEVNSLYSDSVSVWTSLILIQGFEIFSAYTKTTKKGFHRANDNDFQGGNYSPYNVSYTH
jgi:hypothetical protein